MDSNDKNYIIILILIGLFAAGVIFASKKNVTPVNSLPVEEQEVVLGTSPQLQNQEIKKETLMPKTYSSQPTMQLEKDKNYKAVLNTSKGAIKIDLFENQTPVTVNNFVFLAKEGFYNGTKFHRIIKGFMIQGGDPRGNGTGGPGYKFADEAFDGNYDRGVIAMANSRPNTNGSQFFIMHQDNQLPKNYVIFGKVEDEQSLQVVDQIANTTVTSGPSGERSLPLEEIVVESIDITL